MSLMLLLHNLRLRLGGRYDHASGYGLVYCSILQEPMLLEGASTHPYPGFSVGNPAMMVVRVQGLAAPLRRALPIPVRVCQLEIRHQNLIFMMTVPFQVNTVHYLAQM